MSVSFLLVVVVFVNFMFVNEGKGNKKQSKSMAPRGVSMETGVLILKGRRLEDPRVC